VTGLVLAAVALAFLALVLPLLSEIRRAIQGRDALAAVTLAILVAFLATVVGGFIGYLLTGVPA
jgi:ABC-type sulfate transport system permease component